MADQKPGSGSIATAADWEWLRQAIERLNRLLREAPPSAASEWSAGPRPILALGAIMLMTASLIVAILQPAALYSVHMALEHLVE